MHLNLWRDSNNFLGNYCRRILSKIEKIFSQIFSFVVYVVCISIFGEIQILLLEIIGNDLENFFNIFSFRIYVLCT